MKGATEFVPQIVVAEFVSIHAPNEGSDAQKEYILSHLHVSIHAPNEGSDKVKK